MIRLRGGQILVVIATWAALGAVPAMAATPAPATSPAASAPSGTAHPQWQLIEGYCLECHNTEDWSGEVAFDTMDADSVPADGKIWEVAIKKVRGGLMPPPASKQPDAAAKASLIAWLETTLDTSQTQAHVGHIPLRRLNRREYANSIRDLIGLNIDPSILPQDELKDGFDTNAELLQVTPNFLDQSLGAARTLAQAAVGDAKAPPIDTTYGNIANMIISLPPRPAAGATNQQKYRDGMPFGTRGGMVAEHIFPADGEYALTIGDLALAREVPKMEFENTVIALLDGREFFRTTVGGERDHKAIDQKLDDAVFAVNNRLRDIRFQATAGQHKLAVTFLRRSYAESDDRTRQNNLDGGQQRVPGVHALQIKGPIKVTGVSSSASRQKLFVCTPASVDEEAPCAQQIVRTLATRAFRRPVTEDEMRPLLAFFERGRKADGFEAGIRDATSAILASPYFLYRAEAASAQGARELTDLELASRMSYFLWSSLPDDELRDLAVRNELSKPGVLATQVRRMIRDPRGVSLTKDFAFQWLNVAKMDTIVPAGQQFSHASGVNDPRPLFRRELELFMDSILRSDRSVVDLLTADHTFLNEPLALLYGMQDVKGSGFHEVTLQDPKRHGLLGKGAVLMLTANPDRTAPVLRGAWILERILGTPSANPPNNVPDLNEAAAGKPTTVRERTELHRRNRACASCHDVMDPLGFALENFDTVGQFRAVDTETRRPIDTAATLPDGTVLKGPEDLHQALAARGGQLAQTITEKLLTYAVGRHLDHRDMPAVRRIVREAAANNYRFESIVLGVVNSDAFRRRESVGAVPASTVARSVD